MWRSGVARRRAHTALLEAIDNAARSGNATAPWRDAPQLWEFFRDEADILVHLQRHWRTALAGAIYVAIEAGEGDLKHDVQTAFEKTERKHHGIRLVLEAHADHPAITASMRKEQALLSAFTDRSTGGAPQAA